MIVQFLNRPAHDSPLASRESIFPYTERIIYAERHAPVTACWADFFDLFNFDEIWLQRLTNCGAAICTALNKAIFLSGALQFYSLLSSVIC